MGLLNQRLIIDGQGNSSIPQISDSTGPVDPNACIHINEIGSLNIFHSEVRSIEPAIGALGDVPVSWRMNLVAHSGSHIFIASRAHILVNLVDKTTGKVSPFACLRARDHSRGSHHGPAPISDAGDGVDDSEPEDDQEQLINAVRIGMLLNKSVLVAIDTLANVNVWDAKSLDLMWSFPSGGGKSAWSIAFGPASSGILFIGSNAHVIAMHNVMSLDSQGQFGSPVLRLAPHHHNIPSIDYEPNDRLLVSASIDGHCGIIRIPDAFVNGQTGGELTLNRDNCLEIGLVDLESWCWTCRIIRFSDIERRGDYPIRPARSRIQLTSTRYGEERSTSHVDSGYPVRHNIIENRPRDSGLDSGLTAEDIFALDVIEDLAAAEIDADDFGDFEAEEDASYEQDAALVPEENWTTDDEQAEISHTSNFPTDHQSSSSPHFSDTAYLNARRLGRSSLTISEDSFMVQDNYEMQTLGNSDLEDIHVGDITNRVRHSLTRRPCSSVPRQLHKMEFSVPKSTVSLIAVTTISNLIIIDPDSRSVLFNEPLDQIVPREPADELISWNNPIFLTFNRLNMMEWVPEIGCLLIGNQNGRLAILHLLASVAEDEHGEAKHVITLEGCSVEAEPLAPIAGFTAYQCQPVEKSMAPLHAICSPYPESWRIYIVYGDGTRTIVHVDRQFTALDISNVNL